MAKLSIVAGATSQSVNVFVRDSSSTTGAGLAAVAPAGGSLLSGTKLYYSFTGANASAGVAVSLAVLATVGAAWSSAGIVTLDGTNLIGWVRIDIPNAALASGKGRVVSFLLFGGTNMAPTPFEIELESWDNQVAIAQTGDSFARLGAPAGASIAADLAEIEAETDGIAAIPTNPFTGTLAQIATAVWTDTTAGDFTTALSIGKSVMNGVSLGTGLTINGYTGNTPQTGDCFARLGAPAGASIAADLAEIEAETDGIAAIPTNPFTGTLAQIATQVWTDTTAGDFTVAASIGKSVMNGVALGTGLTINAYTGDTPQTGDSFARIGAAGAGLTAILTTAMTESYAAKGVQMTAAQALYLLQAWLTNLSISGTTYTAKKLDGTTTAATGTLDSSTTPTQNLRAT